MSGQKSKSIESLPATGASCGLKPSKEALEKGYEIDFSQAENALKKSQEEQSKSDK